MTAPNKHILTLLFAVITAWGFAQHSEAAHETNLPEAHDGHNKITTEHTPASTEHESKTGCPCGEHSEEEGAFNAGDNAVHHIADANAIHLIGDRYFPLPMMLYAPDKGWTFTHSGAFEAHHHGNGTLAIDRYVLVHGNVMRVADRNFPAGKVGLQCGPTHHTDTVNGKEKVIYSIGYNNKCYTLEAKSSLDGGVMGGGITGFFDYSITRNVFTMLLTVTLLFLLFGAVVRGVRKNTGKAPTGIQNFFEPLYLFIRDEVAKPNIGPKHEKYMPYLLSAFFFILGLNLIGQVPFFPGSANVTGNISITIVLALITFIISTFSANKHFWSHTLWMPGVPTVLKIFIITPIEIMGIFLKPFTLLLRLFANITAGHIVILSFVSLIFIFGNAGESLTGSITGVLASVPLTLFMMTLELLVAFLQAFIFTMLSATYIGAAVEEPHHHH
jgi:F-type H+-transporting ATPase subunit a